MLFFLLLCAHTCVAVKSFMFRKCSQNPFCQRNLEFGTDPPTDVYSISDINLDNPLNITGHIRKILTPEELPAALGASPDGSIYFDFFLEMVNDDIYRVVVDEKFRVIEDQMLQNVLNPERFDPAAYVLDYSQQEKWKPTVVPKIEAEENGFIIEYGNYNLMEVTYSPLRIEFRHKGFTMIALNDENMFNIEHIRHKQPTDPPSWWADRFDKHTDKHVRGPESISLDTKFVGFQHLYGIPEHADTFDLRDTMGDPANHEPYRLFNVDIFQYDTESVMPLYGSIPFLLGQKKTGSAGVFWMNSADTYVDIDKSIIKHVNAHWMSETGKMDLFVILGDTMKEVETSYGVLTGTLAMPQLFALGYHQCRWNYRTQDELLEVDKLMDEAMIPYDVIWLDIDWTNERKYFQWNKENYPDPELMMQKLDAKNRKLVVLNDPHILVEKGYDIYEKVNDGFAILDPRGTKSFVGHCWPGKSIWIDGLHPEAAKKWSEFCAMGTDIGGNATNLHLWSDMSEPSVFSGSETTAYKDLIHYGGHQHRDVHNVYGHTIFGMTTDALYERYEGKQRPFVLTRSFFAGSQRYGPAWTGDNQAEWKYLQAATPMLLSLGVSGMPFVGADVGGFFKDPSDELLTRWYQSGAFYPFFRAHAHEDSGYREPYLLEGDYGQAIQSAIQIRYELIPHYYTLFHDAHVSLQPIIRPLIYEFPFNEDMYEVEDEFMIGSELLAMPIVIPDAREVLVKFPSLDPYYEYFSGGTVPGSPLMMNVNMYTIPLFVRGGSAVFKRDRRRRSTSAMKNDPYTVILAQDVVKHAKGHLYVDDGETYAFEDGKYLDFEIVKDDDGIHGHVKHYTEGFDHLEIETLKVYGGNVTETRYARLETEDEEESYLLRLTPRNYGYSIDNPKLPVAKDWFIRLY